MNTENGNEAAYPAVASYTDENPSVMVLQNAGLSKRELIAAMCLQGFFASGSPFDVGMCRTSIHAADELLNQLNSNQ